MLKSISYAERHVHNVHIFFEKLISPFLGVKNRLNEKDRLSQHFTAVSIGVSLGCACGNETSYRPTRKERSRFELSIPIMQSCGNRVFFNGSPSKST